MALTQARRSRRVIHVEPDQLPSAWKNGAVVLAVTASITLVALVVAAQAGMQLDFDRVDGRKVSVRPGIGVISLALGVLVGTALLDLIGRRSPRAWMGVAWAGLAFGILSTAAPLSSTAGTGVTTLLVSLHVLAGVTWFTVLTRSLRRAPAGDLQHDR